jgi:hypothetical protein
MNHIRQWWDLFVAAVVAAVTTIWIKPHVTNDITTELIAFFAIQAAVILPAMIMTAGILRGDGLQLAEVDAYHNALRRQMHFWVTLLALDFLCVTFLIIGKAVEWKINLPIWHVTAPVKLGDVFVGVTVFAVALCFLRMIPFVRGVISLLEMNSNLVRISIKERERRANVAETLRTEEIPFHPPEDYGRIVGPH